MSREELMKRIHALSFAMTEAQLFLDTHPECRDALTYFRDTRDQLDTLMTEYQNKYGPLFADMTVGDKWNWVDGPWPWQHNGKED
jgi:spore coat protein JB